MDSSSRPAMLLVTGRSVGLAASFAIGIVLARMFDPAVFGVYKQFFLIYATIDVQGRAALDELEQYRWYFMVPLVLALLQLGVGWFLGRRGPTDEAPSRQP